MIQKEQRILRIAIYMTTVSRAESNASHEWAAHVREENPLGPAYIRMGDIEAFAGEIVRLINKLHKVGAAKVFYHILLEYPTKKGMFTGPEGPHLAIIPLEYDEIVVFEEAFLSQMEEPF